MPGHGTGPWLHQHLPLSGRCGGWAVIASVCGGCARLMDWTLATPTSPSQWQVQGRRGYWCGCVMVALWRFHCGLDLGCTDPGAACAAAHTRSHTVVPSQPCPPTFLLPCRA